MSKLSRLHQAIVAEDIQEMTEIIKHGADINAVFNQETAFTKALTVRCLAAADVIMASSHFDPNAGNQLNISPLLVSVREDRIHYVNRLLSMGAGVNDANIRGNTPLMACAWTDNADIARLLIDHGADVNQTDVMGRIALHHACSNVAVKVASLLVGYKCNLNHRSSNRETPLMCALPSMYNSQVAQKKVSDMLFISEMLIHAGSNLNAQDERGKTALHRMVECHDIHGLCLLAEGGCEINIKDKSGQTPFQMALSQHPPQFDIARFLLYFGADPNKIVLHLSTTLPVPPLSLLLKLRSSSDELEHSWSCDRLLQCLQRCVYPTPALVQTVSDTDRNIPPEQDVARNVLQWLQANQPCSLQFQSMLKIRQALGSRHVFHKISCLPVSSFLKEYLCLGLKQDWLPLTTFCYLHVHIREHENAMVKQIIQDKHNISLFIGGRTPLAVALEAGNMEIAKMLLSSSQLCPNIVNSAGDNALHVAARYGRDELIDDIIKRYKDVDKMNFKKCTPLKVAIEAGNFTTAAILIKKGADVTSPRGSISLLHMAAACGCPEVVELILSRGVSPNLLDKYKNTPLHLAASKGGLYVQKQITVPGLYRDPFAESLDAIRMILNASQPKFIKPDTGHAEVVKCLISHGASLTMVNKDRETPEQCAELYLAEDVLDVLSKSAV